MGLRFRQSFQLFPGVRVNIGKRGTSVSFGVPGASLNFGQQGLRGTVGLPGTGLSYSQRFGALDESSGHSPANVAPPAAEGNRALPAVYSPNLDGMRRVGSAAVDRLSSPNLVELRDMLLAARAQKADVDRDLAEARAELQRLQIELRRKEGSIFRFFHRKRIAALGSNLLPEVDGEVARLAAWNESTVIEAGFEESAAATSAWGELVRRFSEMTRSPAIWDITLDRKTDRKAERTLAHRSIDRSPVRLNFAGSDLVRFAGKAMTFGNANGEQLMFYPGFLLVPRADGMFALVDITHVDMVFDPVRFHEDESVPAGAEIVGSTWAKTNKDGSPDRRYRDNFEIPICLYGSVAFKTASGLNEEYLFSSAPAAYRFAEAFIAYRHALREP